MKYRKRPVVVEAIPAREISEAYTAERWLEIEGWVRQAHNDGRLLIRSRPTAVIISRHEGVLMAGEDDLIVCEESGRLDVVPASVFADLYETAIDPAPFSDLAQGVWGINFLLPDDGVEWRLKDDLGLRLVLQARAKGLRGRQHLLNGLMDMQRIAREGAQQTMREGV